MEVIKRKILLENSTDRTYETANYGQMTATTFYLKISLTQDIDNMGIFNDMSFIENNGINSTPDYSILIDKLNYYGFSFPFMSGDTPELVAASDVTLRLTGQTENDYYNFGQLIITAMTDTKSSDIKSYIRDKPFIPGFVIEEEVYNNFKDDSLDGVSLVTITGNPMTYIIDTDYYDLNLGTPLQMSGLLYNDYSGNTRNVNINDESRIIPVTTVSYHGEGWNKTNTSISALTKEEYLFGIISPPEVESDIYIDRGVTSVMDKHLRLSEVITLDELSRYGNGLFNIGSQ